MTPRGLLGDRSAQFALFTVAVVASAPVVRPAAEDLRARGWLEAATLAITVAGAAGAAVWVALAVRRRRLRRPVVLAVVATAYALLFRASSALPEERVHLVQFGIIGLLALRVARLTPESTPIARATAACLLAFLAGFIDEAFQGLLPNRVYDPRDVGLDFLASSLAIVAAESCAPPAPSPSSASAPGGAARSFTSE